MVNITSSILSGYAIQRHQRLYAMQMREESRCRHELAHSWPSLREAERSMFFAGSSPSRYADQFYGITLTRTLLDADDVLYDPGNPKLWPVRLVTTCIPEVRHGR